MSQSNCKEEIVDLLLDFEGNEHVLTKQKSAFFNIYNLDKSEPIIQLNEDIYTGTWDSVLGTNLFFKRTDNCQSADIFEPPITDSVEYVFKQYKLVTLKKIGTSQKFLIDTNSTDSIKVNLPENYKTIIEKYSKGEWNIDDYKVDSVQATKEVNQPVQTSCTLSNEETTNLGWFSELIDQDGITGQRNNFEKKSICQAKYLQLTQLVEESMKVASKKMTMENSTNEDKFQCWEKLMLERATQQPIILDIDKEDIHSFVDVEGSIELQIIETSQEFPRIFTDEEKNKLLDFKNFYNLSPLVKLKLLQDYINFYKAAVSKMDTEQTNKLESDNKSPLDKLKCLENMHFKLKDDIVSRIKVESKDYLEDFEFLENNDEDDYETEEDQEQCYSSDSSEHEDM